MIATDINLTYKNIPVQLTISTDSLILKRLNDLQILYSHKMEGISFASAGEHVTIFKKKRLKNYLINSFILGNKRLYCLCCKR